jgi:copper chaperone CopZ
MKKTYSIAGMTCEGCRKTVTEALEKNPDIREVSVDLASGQATIETSKPLTLEQLQKDLPQKYTVDHLEQQDVFSATETPSKLRQLRPLLLIFAYLIVASVLLNYQEGSYTEGMLDFMGLFFIVFSFFKFLDLKGFPDSFAMYDPLARSLPIYGWIYPFVELALGLLFLMRLFLLPALITTIVVLSITTFGVTRTLLDKKTIGCACLGTALKLPMTEATFIENAIMLIMAFVMIFKGGLL